MTQNLSAHQLLTARKLVTLHPSGHALILMHHKIIEYVHNLSQTVYHILSLKEKKTAWWCFPLWKQFNGSLLLTMENISILSANCADMFYSAIYNKIKSTSDHKSRTCNSSITWQHKFFWGRHKMAAIFQTTFSNAFSWVKIYEFRLRFHLSLFPRVHLTICQHWFWYWFGADQATSHYLNQWWLVYWRIYASLCINELLDNAGVLLYFTSEYLGDSVGLRLDWISLSCQELLFVWLLQNVCVPLSLICVYHKEYINKMEMKYFFALLCMSSLYFAVSNLIFVYFILKYGLENVHLFKTVLSGMRISTLKIRRSRDRLFFNMGNPILVRRLFLYWDSPSTLHHSRPMAMMIFVCC